MVAVTPQALPNLITGPWSDEARRRAIEGECLAVIADFFTRSVPRRMWEPLRDLPVEEIRALGPRLSEDTIDLIEGFMGVEEHVGDYVQAGLDAFRATPYRRRFILQWGAEEARHGAALHQVLLHSGARTESQLDDYGAKVADRAWSLTQHKGMDQSIGAFAYTAVQERATYVNYVELRRRIRSEYGLPDNATDVEARRGQEFGASEALRLIARDEIAHHAVYLSILQNHLRYFPDRTAEKIAEVVDGFTMPALKLIPNRHQFIRAVLRTRVYSEEIHQARVVAPMLKLLGIGGERVGDGKAG